MSRVTDSIDSMPPAEREALSELARKSLESRLDADVGASVVEAVATLEDELVTFLEADPDVLLKRFEEAHASHQVITDALRSARLAVTVRTLALVCAVLALAVVRSEATSAAFGDIATAGAVTCVALWSVSLGKVSPFLQYLNIQDGLWRERIRCLLYEKVALGKEYLCAGIRVKDMPPLVKVVPIAGISKVSRDGDDLVLVGHSNQEIVRLLTLDANALSWIEHQVTENEQRTIDEIRKSLS